MSQVNADRNLLLGILAYQNAFVTRDALFAGMQAWLYDKTKSLADILQNQGALDAERRQLLDAMVQHHLKQHGDDPQRSLQAVSSASSVRSDLEKMPDPEFQASLVHLSQAKDDDDPFHTRTFVGTPTSAGTRFRRLRLHAKGGLGEVFVALDSELNREVALKEIQDRHADEPGSRTRFLQEAEITGGLEHPGIVPVYGLGTYADGRPFYAMRFIRGDSLMEAIAKYHKSQPPRPRGESSNPAGAHAASDKNLHLHKLVRRLIDVCNALQYAHDRGVLHRDLKPGNIMLGKYGETLVVDWGLAKAGTGAPTSTTGAGESPLRPASGSGSAETLPGSAIGTPAYMSPEQAAGRLDLVGAASDIYSIGATLYCLLTGRPPFKGDVAEVLKRAQEGDFPRPGEVDPNIAPPLEAVCLKAMALRPEDRYATPQQLAEDLEHWLADEPVKAWPEPWTVKARRWTNRHRVLVSSAAACLVVTKIALVAGVVLVSQANADLETANQTIRTKEQETATANKNLVDANEVIKTAHGKLVQSEKGALALAGAESKARDRAEDLLSSSTMMLARSRFEEGQTALAEDLLSQVPSKFRAAPWRLLSNYIAGSRFTLHGHADWVTSVTFSPDGQVLASASQDNTVKLWDARTGLEFRTLRGHTARIGSVAFSPDGQVLASASQDNMVKLWDARTGLELRSLRGHRYGVTSVAFAADGQVLASAGHDGTIKLWDAGTGQELRTLPGHASSVSSVAISPDGQMLASASWDNTVKLWDARSGRELRTLRGHEDMVTSVAFAADGQALASASMDRTVRLWDARTGQGRTLRGHTEPVESAAFAADGKVLASASRDGTVKVWDARTGQELQSLRGHTGSVWSVAYAADGQTLASASNDLTVKVWDVRRQQELRTLRGHTGAVLGAAFAADGELLASASVDHSVKLWNARTGLELRTLRGHSARVESVAFASVGQVLASAGHDNTVKLWDTRTGRELRTLRGHTAPVMSVAFAPDGQVLASTSYDLTVKLWDVPTGQDLRTLHAKAGHVLGVAFAPDGRMLASAHGDQTVRLWDARTGQELHTLHGHTIAAFSVAFTADGQMLASAGQDGVIKLWDARTYEELRTLRGHTGPVGSVAFAADGQVLASAGWDNMVKLWDARTGQELRTLHGHSQPARSVAFAADGQILASTSTDGTLKLWDVRTGQDLRALRGHKSYVTRVKFSADGRLLATSSDDKTVKLWDARTGQELYTLRGHTASVSHVAIDATGQMLASASQDRTVRLWDARTGQELHTLPGHWWVASLALSPDGLVLAAGHVDGRVMVWDTRTGHELRTLRGHSSGIETKSSSEDGKSQTMAVSYTGAVERVAFAADGKTLWSQDISGIVLAWETATGKLLPTSPPGIPAPDGTGAWSPDGSVLALGRSSGLIVLIPRAIPESERRFRTWVTAPDLHLHREMAEQAEQENQPLAVAFRLGRYLAGKSSYAAARREAASDAGWVATGVQQPGCFAAAGLLAGLPIQVRTPFHEPALPDGIACSGVLYKDSGIAPERLLIGTSRALAGDPSNWLNHALHGGALFRKGEHAKALAALTEAARLHGKPSPLTHNLLGLTHLAMGEKDRAKDAFSKAQPAKDAAWEDVALQRFLQPEVDAALAKADGKKGRVQ